jgi:hypothetical protein
MQKYALRQARLGKRFQIALTAPARREIGSIAAFELLGAARQRAIEERESLPNGDFTAALRRLQEE